MRALLLLALIGTLSGCATQYWHFPSGGNNLQFNQDSYSCTQETQQQSSSAYVNAYGGAAQSGTHTNIDLYNQCMYARGYYLGNKPVSPPKVQMSDALYVSYVQGKIEASKCVANGWLAPEIGTLADRFYDEGLINYIYDKQKLSETWTHESSTYTPSQSNCDRLATFVRKAQEIRGNRP